MAYLERLIHMLPGLGPSLAVVGFLVQLLIFVLVQRPLRPALALLIPYAGPLLMACVTAAVRTPDRTATWAIYTLHVTAMSTVVAVGIAWWLARGSRLLGFVTGLTCLGLTAMVWFSCACTIAGDGP